MTLLNETASEGTSEGVENQSGQTSQEAETEALANQSMTGEDSNDGESGEPSWFYDENTPGVGERPEWLKDKYKSAADQAKAYNELDKKLGKFKGAPDEYDLSLPDLPDFQFEEGDPVLGEFLDFAKESNASQEFVTKALEHYVKAQQFYAPDPQEELQKLGANAQVEISQLTEWAGQRLNKEEFDVFKNMITTADSFRVIQKLRRVSTSSPEIAVNKNVRSEPQVSEREVMELIGDERFNTDPLFRKEVEQKAAKLWG
jgi:hypothetical protein